MNLICSIGLYLILIFLDLLIGKITIQFSPFSISMREPLLGISLLCLSTLWLGVSILFGRK